MMLVRWVRGCIPDGKALNFVLAAGYDHRARPQIHSLSQLISARGGTINAASRGTTDDMPTMDMPTNSLPLKPPPPPPHPPPFLPRGGAQTVAHVVGDSLSGGLQLALRELLGRRYRLLGDHLRCWLDAARRVISSAAGTTYCRQDDPSG